VWLASKHALRHQGAKEEGSCYVATPSIALNYVARAKKNCCLQLQCFVVPSKSETRLAGSAASLGQFGFEDLE